MSYHAPQNWQQVLHAEDVLIREMIDPDTIMQLMLSYTETEQDRPGSESLRRT